MSKTIEFTVMRGQGSELKPKQLSVPYSEGMTVLDALIIAKAAAAHGLAFRYACRNGFTCRQCLVLIDGKPQYMCTTVLSPGMVVAPLRDRSVRDLVSET